MDYEVTVSMFYIYQLQHRMQDKIYILPAICWGLIPIPSSVIIAEVDGSTRNSSAAYFNTAVNGVVSGTLKLKKSEPVNCCK